MNHIIEEMAAATRLPQTAVTQENNQTEGQTGEVSTAQTAADRIIDLALDKILPHPMNKLLFGETSPDEITAMAESIADVGQLSPVVVTADLEKIGCFALLSGHKRIAALKKLNRATAKAQEVNIADADIRLYHLLESNRQHKPTMEQSIRIGGVYFGLETRRAKARQIAGAKSKKGAEAVETSTPPTGTQQKATDDEGATGETGKARDLAAKKIGMSGVSFDKGRKVVKAIDENPKTAAELRQLLNEKGIDPAYARADVLKLIEKAKKSGTAGSKTVVQGGQGGAANQPQNSAASSAAPEKDAAVPAPAGIDGSAEQPAVEQEAEQIPSTDEVKRQPEAEAIDADEQAPGARAVAIGVKFVEELKKITFPDLSADLKHNLRRILDDVKTWHADREEMLKGPGQP